MRIMVCGGAGFIGSHYLDYLLENYIGDFVLCFDALSYAGKEENFSHHINKKNFAFVKGDICNKEEVERAVKKYKIDAIVNFAAQSHVDRSILSAEEFLRTNVLGVNVLLEICREFNLKRFHQVSTDEVYGDLPLESQSKFDESWPIAPSSAYSASKASADLLVLAQARTHNLPVTISRCCNNFGARQHEEKFIPTMVKHALFNKPLPIYGTGENVREWIEVKEHCKAVDLILRKGKLGQVYNVSGNVLLSNLQMAKKILNILQKPQSLISFVEDRKGHDRKYAVNGDKIKEELGYTPSFDFEKEFEKCVLYYRDEFLKND